jgi:hypothetical protein
MDYLFVADTLTAPTVTMLKYAFDVASLGDDVFNGDWCTNQLEGLHFLPLCVGDEA